MELFFLCKNNENCRKNEKLNFFFFDFWLFKQKLIVLAVASFSSNILLILIYQFDLTYDLGNHEFIIIFNFDQSFIHLYIVGSVDCKV